MTRRRLPGNPQRQADPVLRITTVILRVAPLSFQIQTECEALALHPPKLPSQPEPDPILGTAVAGQAFASRPLQAHVEQQPRRPRLRQVPAEAELPGSRVKPQPHLRRATLALPRWMLARCKATSAMLEMLEDKESGPWGGLYPQEHLRWGGSALSRVSGIDFETLPEAEQRRINALPAMIYHGVRSEDAVLIEAHAPAFRAGARAAAGLDVDGLAGQRMNPAPRSAAEALGNLYREVAGGDEHRYSLGKARAFLKGLAVADWRGVRPEGAPLSGAGYKRVWEILSGEAG